MWLAVQLATRNKMTILTENTNFSEVLKYIKDGAIAYRSGWHGKQLKREMYIYVENPYERHGDMKVYTNTPTGQKEIQPYLCLVISDQLICGWLASQTDMLSDDWVVEEVDE